jgi:hypothetical protein
VIPYNGGDFTLEGMLKVVIYQLLDFPGMKPAFLLLTAGAAVIHPGADHR